MLKRKLQAAMIIIVFMMLYYSFFMDFLLGVKDSIVGVMQDHNLTTITINQKVYNVTSHQWVDQPKQFDLTGFVDLVMDLVIVFAPLIVAVKYLWW